MVLFEKWTETAKDMNQFTCLQILYFSTPSVLRRNWYLVASVLLVVWGGGFLCNGVSSADDLPTNDRPQPIGTVVSVDTVTPVPLQRTPTRILTTTELNHSLGQLFPSLQLTVSTFSADSRVGPFILNARENVTLDQIRDFRLAAERAAWMASQRLDEIMTCDDGEALVACVRRFIQSFAARAYRRPLESDVTDALIDLYHTGAEMSHEIGMQYIFEAVLQSPSFIYISERVNGEGDTYRLDDYDIAAQMSAICWRGLPDELLTTVAESGQLRESSVRAEHALRMLTDARGHAAIQAMIAQWFGIDQIRGEDVLKLKLYEIADPQRNLFAESSARETERLVDDILTKGDASFFRLLTAEYTYVDELLAKHYGFSLDNATPVDEGVWRVETPKRAGLLTHASFLSLHTGPVQRGLAIRTLILGDDVPAPEGIDTNSIPAESGESERTASAKRLATDACSFCHEMMDPLGLTFDMFDILGRFREKDSKNNTLSGEGELIDTDIDGKVTSIVELSRRLAESEQVRKALARNLFTWSFARSPKSHEASLVDHIAEVLQENHGNLVEGLVSIIASDSFIWRRHDN